MVHGEVTFAVLDSEIFAVSRCCLSSAIQHLGPPTETHEVVVVVVPTVVPVGLCGDHSEKKLYRSVFASIRILGTMYSRSWAHNLSARMGLEVRGACNEPL